MALEDGMQKSTKDSTASADVHLVDDTKLSSKEGKGPILRILSNSNTLVAGGVAGGVSRTIVAPLERLKILLQVQSQNNTKYNGTIQGLKYIFKTDGFRGLFIGNGTNCARIIPNSAVKFFVYEHASRGILWLYQHQTGNESAQLNPLMRLGGGACGGIMAMSVTYPLDMVRGRISVQVQADKSAHHYRGMFHALATIYKQEGLRSLYKGWVPSVIGAIPYTGFNFAVYESMKELFTAKQPPQPLPFGAAAQNPNKEIGTLPTLVCGSAAGLVGQSVAYPLDVIRRRMQMAGWKHAASLVTGYGSSVPQYSGMVDAFRKTVAGEGYAALYKGLVPNSAKVVPSVAISFMTFEKVKSMLDAADR